MPIIDTEFFEAHREVDVQADFHEEVDRELVAVLGDFRPGVTPQLGDVLVAGCWGARPAKVQVIEISAAWVRLRVLD
ncbi:MAG: hypothetical protein ACKOJG_02315 [Actinomycetota bacterium]